MTLIDSFASKHLVFAMLHLKGETPTQRLQRAQQEIDLLWESGVDAVIVENYFGTTDDMVSVCEYLCAHRPEVVFGVNALEDDARGFELADRYGARFLQLDSVAGHLPPDEDERFGKWIAERRASSSAFVLGGVRFKYQPYRSGRSLAEDLQIGLQRCDAIVVTGDGTGIETPLAKLIEFREAIGPGTPLIVGAGATVASVKSQLALADGVIVGSALKDTRRDTGDVSLVHARQFVNAVRALEQRPTPIVLGTELATPQNFSEFGRLVPLNGTQADSVVVTDGPGWTDSYSREPILDTTASLGHTIAGSGPWTVTQMERHIHTEEAAICTTQELVLAVAPASEQAPDSTQVRAFVIPKSNAAVLNRGVWHDACHGFRGPIDYLWLADCSVDEPEGWVPVAGPPVEIDTTVVRPTDSAP